MYIFLFYFILTSSQCFASDKTSMCWKKQELRHRIACSLALDRITRLIVSLSEAEGPTGGCWTALD